MLDAVVVAGFLLCFKELGDEVVDEGVGGRGLARQGQGLGRGGEGAWNA